MVTRISPPTSFTWRRRTLGSPAMGVAQNPWRAAMVYWGRWREVEGMHMILCEIRKWENSAHHLSSTLLAEVDYMLDGHGLNRKLWVVSPQWRYNEYKREARAWCKRGVGWSPDRAQQLMASHGQWTHHRKTLMQGKNKSKANIHRYSNDVKAFHNKSM